MSAIVSNDKQLWEILCCTFPELRGLPVRSLQLNMSLDEVVTLTLEVYPDFRPDMRTIQTISRHFRLVPAEEHPGEILSPNEQGLIDVSKLSDNYRSWHKVPFS